MVEQEEKVVVFKLGNEEFGISISQVLSIEKMMDFTTIPEQSEHIRGIVELRGKVLPIIDLRKFLLSEEIEDNIEANRIIVVNVEDNMMGLIVDEAKDVMDINLEEVNHVDLPGSKAAVKISKFNDRMIIILDIKDLVLKENLLQSLDKIKEAV